MNKRLTDFYYEVKSHARVSLGYPCNNAFDYSELFPFLDLFMNNVGDPYDNDSSYKCNTKEFEVEVLDFYSDLLKIDRKESWGYATSGGTEGNLHSLYVARERLSNPEVYYSEDTHYSVPKIVKLLDVNNSIIPSLDNGEINYDILANTISRNNRDIIIFANIGTTMKGAIDNITTIRDICAGRRVHIHADAALSGMILPFLNTYIPHNFADGIDSISISGHKFIGSPMPCGIVMTKKEYVDNIGSSIEYIKSNDTTILGSRDSITPLFMWYSIQKHGVDGYKEIVKRCMDVTKYTVAKLNDIEGLDAWCNDNSITTVFNKNNIPTEVLKKYQIATHGDIGHIITMPQITESLIDKFVEDVNRYK